MIKLVALTLCVVGLSTSCPAPELISPCKCSSHYELSCDGDQITQVALESVFAKLSSDLAREQKTMKSFLLQSTQVHTLKAEMFRDMSFEKIVIYNNDNLSIVESAAFYPGNTEVTRQLVLQGNDKLADLGGSRWAAVAMLTKLEDLQILEGSNITTIPALAFPPAMGFQERLKSLVIEEIGYPISKLTKLETRAFWYLSWLDRLTLERTSIEHIPEHAFELENPPKSRWTIDLGNHYHMDGSAFAAHSLSKIGRPVTLVLPGSKLYEGGPVNFKYLYENAFYHFFSAHPDNLISGSVRVNCHDCRNVWLKSYPQYLKNIPGIMCFAKNKNENYNFSDPSNFDDC